VYSSEPWREWAILSRNNRYRFRNEYICNKTTTCSRNHFPL
jgi:hypothetical protein